MKNRLQHVLCALDAMERTARMQSPLHRTDARAKLLVTVVFLVTMLSVPPYRLSELLLFFVYRYLFVLIEEAAAMQQARDARSFGRKSYPLKVWGTLVGQLLIRTFDRAERISRAMLARGFTGRIPEGMSERPAWKMRDTLFLAAWCSALVLLRLCRPAENFSMLINNF